MYFFGKIWTNINYRYYSYLDKKQSKHSLLSKTTYQRKHWIKTYFLRLEECEAQQYTKNGFLASSAQAAMGAKTLVCDNPHSLRPSATSKAACIADAASVERW